MGEGAILHDYYVFVIKCFLNQPLTVNKYLVMYLNTVHDLYFPRYY